MKILLDTNAYAALKRGDHAVAALVRRSERIFFSAVVAGELLFGFRHGSRMEANLRELASFLDRSRVVVLPVSLDTADRYGRIAATLRRKGRPLPANDIWIAAQAMEVGADLISFDAHFEEVEGLVFRNPAVSVG